MLRIFQCSMLSPLRSNFASSVTTPTTPTNSVPAAVSSQNTTVTANAYAPVSNAQSTFAAGFPVRPTPVPNRSSSSVTIHDTAILPGAATQQNAFGGIPAVQHAQPNLPIWTGYQPFVQSPPSSGSAKTSPLHHAQSPY